MDGYWIWAGRWGDTASVLGLVLGIIGFVITIRGVYASRSAAERAADAAERARQSVYFVDTLVELSSVLATMEEIKRLHRVEAWPMLPDRYAHLRQRLIRISSSNSELSLAQREIIEEAVQQFARFERRVDGALVAKTGPPNPAKLNQIVSSQIDRVEVILRELQRQQRD